MLRILLLGRPISRCVKNLQIKTKTQSPVVNRTKRVYYRENKTMTYSQAASASSSIRKSYGRNQNTTAFASSRSRLGPISHLIILTIIISMMGLVYLTQVTKTYSLGYKVDELTKRQTALSEEHSNLELESVKLQSQTRVKNSAVAANLETVTPSSYAQ